MNRLSTVSRYLCMVLIVSLLSGCAIISWTASKKFKDSKGNTIQDAKDIVIEAPEQRLPDYETLTFKINWLGIPGGTVTTSVKGIKNINGRDAYILEAVFKSNAFLSAIYKIEDRFISYMDVEKLYTVHHEAYRREGRYHKESITEFDQEHHMAHFKNWIDLTEKTFDIPPNVQDTLSAVYYFMLLPLKVGDKIEYSVCNNEENYQLLGIVESKVFIQTPSSGEKQAFCIQPYLKLKGQKVQKGNLSAYFSCDKRRVPLLGVMKGPVFTEIRFTLTKIEASSKVSSRFLRKKP